MRISETPTVDTATIMAFRSARAKPDPIINAASGKPAFAPHRLLGIEGHEHTLDLFFEGLRNHYIEAVLSGRVAVWKNAAHQIIDLMGDIDELKVHPRSAVKNG